MPMQSSVFVWDVSLSLLLAPFLCFYFMVMQGIFFFMSGLRCSDTFSEYTGTVSTVSFFLCYCYSFCCLYLNSVILFRYLEWNVSFPFNFPSIFPLFISFTSVSQNLPSVSPPNFSSLFLQFLFVSPQFPFNPLSFFSISFSFAFIFSGLFPPTFRSHLLCHVIHWINPLFDPSWAGFLTPDLFHKWHY